MEHIRCRSVGQRYHFLRQLATAFTATLPGVRDDRLHAKLSTQISNLRQLRLRIRRKAVNSDYYRHIEEAHVLHMTPQVAESGTYRLRILR
ncbi:hypothetical protein D3C81_1572830 [compost metagenome]